MVSLALRSMDDRVELARWLPGLGQLLRYDPAWLAKDLAAGLSVAAISLPVGIAYADLAGVPAAVGIYAAIFPLVPYALLGSSRQLVVGPDAATCTMVAASLVVRLEQMVPALRLAEPRQRYGTAQARGYLLSAPDH